MVAPVISADVPRIETYTASDGQTEFPITWAYLAESDNRVEVWRDGALVAAYVGGDGDMSCDPAEDAALEDGVAGTATIPACEADDVVHVFAMTTPERDVVFANPADVTRDNLNREANRRVAVEVEHGRDIARAVAVPFGEDGYTLPAAEDVAGELAGFDDDGRLAGTGLLAATMLLLQANLAELQALNAALEAGTALSTFNVVAEYGQARRTMAVALSDRVNVMNYGALGDGSGDTVAEWLVGGAHETKTRTGAGYASLAAIQADYPQVTGLTNTIDWAAAAKAEAFATTMLDKKDVHYPAGEYVMHAKLPTTSGSFFRRSGVGRGQISTLRFLVHDEYFTHNVASSIAYFCTIADLSVVAPATTSTASVFFRAIGSAASATGMQYFSIDRCDAQNCHQGVIFDKTGCTNWAGIPQISSHRDIMIFEFSTLPGANPCRGAVEFKHSMNLQNRFIGGEWRGYEFGLKAGEDTAYCSVGDTLIAGVQLLCGTGPGTNGVPILLIGGSDPACYNENITAVGCQYECTRAPLELTRMYNCRFMGANSNTLQPIFHDCDEATIWFEVYGFAHIPGVTGANGRNYLHNAGPAIWQRGTSFASGAIQPLCDRWKGRRAGNAAGATFSRAAGFAGGRYCMVLARDAGNSGTETIILGQQLRDMEDIEYLAGKTVIVSCDIVAEADYSGGAVTLNVFSGTAEGETFNVATGFATGNVNEGASTVTPTTTPQRVSFARVALNAGIKALGLAFVRTCAGTAGAADRVKLENFQLEAGGVATEFEPEAFEADLATCRRFFRKSFEPATTPAQDINTNTGEITFPAIVAGANTNRSPRITFDPPMWAVPTVTFYNPDALNAQARDETMSAGAGGDCSSTTTENLTRTGFNVSCTTNASTVAGNQIGVHYAANADPA